MNADSRDGGIDQHPSLAECYVTTERAFEPAGGRSWAFAKRRRMQISFLVERIQPEAVRTCFLRGTPGNSRENSPALRDAEPGLADDGMTAGRRSRDIVSHPSIVHCRVIRWQSVLKAFEKLVQPRSRQDRRSPQPPLPFKEAFLVHICEPGSLAAR
jgi:hypothetical protein